VAGDKLDRVPDRRGHVFAGVAVSRDKFSLQSVGPIVEARP
jgi:hypothetical protein